jgi:TolB-like protein
MTPQNRRLATLMAADVVGYSARMESSEAETLAQLIRLTDLIERHVNSAGGRVFSRAGDGFLAEFASPVMAVQAGYEVQRSLLRARENGELDLQLRIGLHLADVVADGEDLLGDGVNIVARIESQAEPDSVLISQHLFEQVKRTAQLAFEDLGKHALKNISEPLRLYRVAGDLGNHSYISGNHDNVQPKPAAQIDPHSIAVLPFANFSGDDEQEYFADGITEDVITELARFRDMFVVSRNSSFAYKGRNIDLRQVGRELGVAFVLEGSVRKMGSRVRITGQLIDTRNGDHIWAEKYDCQFDDLFDVQDELVAKIVSLVAGRMERQTQAIARRKKPADMDAYDCLLHGLEHHRLGAVTRQDAEKAVAWFSKAIEKDPNYGRAYAWKSCSMSTLARQWTHENVFEEAVEIVKRGLELDEDDAECHRIMGSISLYLRDFGKAELHFRRAIELNPNHAFIVGRTGELYTSLGDGRKALEYQKRAVQLDPLLPAYCRELEAAAHYTLGEYQDTVKVVAEMPRPTRRSLAYAIASLVHTDDAQALERTLKELRRLDPDFSVDRFVSMEIYQDQAIPQQLAEELCAAGL